MGILHKLVFVLGKLDPGNSMWKQRQLDKLESVSMREDLEAAFEAKFAAADTLIKIEKPASQGELFADPEVKELEKQLKKVRHECSARKHRKRRETNGRGIKSFVKRLLSKLEENGWSHDSAKQLAKWDPYDQNASSDFFDSEWMFDLKGLDIVIGNPSYISVEKFSGTNSPDLFAIVKREGGI